MILYTIIIFSKGDENLLYILYYIVYRIKLLKLACELKINVNPIFWN